MTKASSTPAAPAPAVKVVLTWNCAAVHPVEPETAVNEIIPVPAKDHVAPVVRRLAPGEAVVALPPDKRVTAQPARKRVIGHTAARVRIRRPAVHEQPLSVGRYRQPARRQLPGADHLL